MPITAKKFSSDSGRYKASLMSSNIVLWTTETKNNQDNKQTETPTNGMTIAQQLCTLFNNCFS